MCSVYIHSSTSDLEVPKIPYWFTFNHFIAKYDIESAMNSFGAAIASGPIDLRVRHIDALAMLLQSKNETKVFLPVGSIKGVNFLSFHVSQN